MYFHLFVSETSVYRRRRIIVFHNNTVHYVRNVMCWSSF